MVPAILQSVFRSHLEESIRRFRLAREGRSIDTFRLAVGFVDLVGFTSISRRMEPRELTDTMERFESTAHEVATANCGHVVKLIGDEVMFVAIDVAAACEIALTHVERFANDPAVTPRGGSRTAGCSSAAATTTDRSSTWPRGWPSWRFPTSCWSRAMSRPRRIPAGSASSPRATLAEGIRRARHAADARAAVTRRRLRTPRHRPARPGSLLPVPPGSRAPGAETCAGAGAGLDDTSALGCPSLGATGSSCGALLASDPVNPITLSSDTLAAVPYAYRIL